MDARLALAALRKGQAMPNQPRSLRPTIETTPPARHLPAIAALAATLTTLPLLAIGGVHTDPLAWVTAVLTLFVGTLVALFSARYLRATPARGRFALLLGICVGCVLGFVFTRDAVVFAIAWIGSGQAMAQLIAHDRNWAEARAARARTVRAFAIGDAALVAALVLAGMGCGTADLPTMLARIAACPPWLPTAATVLLAVAVAVRCSLPPFSSWLLSSMTAPTPVSALMHAGFVNAGGFVLIRFAPLVEAAPQARLAVLLPAAAAVFWGGAVMAVRPDIKRLLAGSTVSQMGFMVLSCALGAYPAALWHLVAHGLFKAWLFLGSGGAIGGQAAKAPDTRAPVLPVAAATLAIALALTWTGAMRADAVALLLALATGAATLFAALAARQVAAARWQAALIVPLLAALQIGGLAAMRALGLTDGALPLPAWALDALLGAVLAGWVWQSRRGALPPRLYVRLLNAGSLVPSAGDA